MAGVTAYFSSSSGAERRRSKQDRATGTLMAGKDSSGKK
jgi:hypothetical protein